MRGEDALASGFVKAFSAMFSANIVAAILGAISTVLVMRNIPLNQWAMVAIIIGLGPSLGVIMSLGSVNFTIRRLATMTSLDDSKALASIFIYRRIVVFFPTLIAGSVSIYLHYDVVGYILAIGALRFLRGGSTVRLSSQRRFRTVGIFLVTEKVFALLFILVSVSSSTVSVATFPIAQMLGMSGYFLLAVFWDRVPVSALLLAQGFWSVREIWRGSSSFGVVSLVGPLQQLDVALVAFASGGVQAGLYGAGSRLLGSLNVAGSALASVALPFFTTGRTIHLSTKQQVKMVLGILLILSSAAVVIGFAGRWVPLLLGNQYAPAVPVISIYMVALILSTFNQPMMAILQAWNDEVRAMWYAVLQGISGLALVLLGAYVGGATLAAFGYLTASLGSTVLVGIRVYVLAKYDLYRVK